jgi:hypothetical protein
MRFYSSNLSTPNPFDPLTDAFRHRKSNPNASSFVAHASGCADTHTSVHGRMGAVAEFHQDSTDDFLPQRTRIFIEAILQLFWLRCDNDLRTAFAILSDWPHSQYSLTDLIRNTLWLTAFAILSDWPHSQYPLNDRIRNILWLAAKKSQCIGPWACFVPIQRRNNRSSSQWSNERWSASHCYLTPDRFW